MPQDELRAGITIGIDELIVQLQNISARVEQARAVGMHDEVHQRLVGEEVWLALQFEEAADAERPIERTKNEEEGRNSPGRAIR